MRNGITERFELLVSGCELGGALDHPQFQFGVETAPLVLDLLALGDILRRSNHAHRSPPFIGQNFSAAFNPADYAIRADQMEIVFVPTASGERPRANSFGHDTV